NGVDGRVAGGFVLTLWPVVAGVVKMHMSTRMRSWRIHAQERMASGDFLDVHQEAVGRLRKERRNLRQVGPRLELPAKFARGVATSETGPGQECDGAHCQD